MNYLNYIALVCLCAITSGCSQDIGPAKNSAGLKPTVPTQKALGPGIHDQALVSKSGEIFRYTICLPDDYQPDKPAPLVFALHFGGQVTPHYAAGIVEALIVPGLEDLGAIVVAPDSIAGPWTNEKNEQMVLELLDHVENEFLIDADKTLLTGFSMGGHGTWYIGSRNQDRFKALIPIASSPQVATDCVWTTPIYAIHSSADTVVPIEAVEKYVAEQQAKSNVDIVFISVEGLPHFQTGRFAQPLKESIPWIEKVWAASQARDN